MGGAGAAGNPFAAMGGAANPFAAMGGGMGGMGGGMGGPGMAEMMNNPAIQQMMQQMFSNPQAMDAVARITVASPS